jgi:hypothetical protein
LEPFECMFIGVMRESFTHILSLKLPPEQSLTADCV